MCEWVIISSTISPLHSPIALPKPIYGAASEPGQNITTLPGCTALLAVPVKAPFSGFRITPPATGRALRSHAPAAETCSYLLDAAQKPRSANLRSCVGTRKAHARGDHSNLLEAEESREVHPCVTLGVRKRKKKESRGSIYHCPWCELGRTSDGGCKTERGAPSLAESKDVPRRT